MLRHFVACDNSLCALESCKAGAWGNRKACCRRRARHAQGNQIRCPKQAVPAITHRTEKIPAGFSTGGVSVPVACSSQSVDPSAEHAIAVRALGQDRQNSVVWVYRRFAKISQNPRVIIRIAPCLQEVTGGYAAEHAIAVRILGQNRQNGVAWVYRRLARISQSPYAIIRMPPMRRKSA